MYEIIFTSLDSELLYKTSCSKRQKKLEQWVEVRRLLVCIQRLFHISFALLTGNFKLICFPTDERPTIKFSHLLFVFSRLPGGKTDVGLCILWSGHMALCIPFT